MRGRATEPKEDSAANEVMLTSEIYVNDAADKSESKEPSDKKAQLKTPPEEKEDGTDKPTIDLEQ